MCPFVGIKSFWYVSIYLESFKLQTHTLHAGQWKKCWNEEFLVNLSEFLVKLHSVGQLLQECHLKSIQFSAKQLKKENSRIALLYNGITFGLKGYPIWAFVKSETSQKSGLHIFHLGSIKVSLQSVLFFFIINPCTVLLVSCLEKVYKQPTSDFVLEVQGFIFPPCVSCFT